MKELGIFAAAFSATVIASPFLFSFHRIAASYCRISGAPGCCFSATSCTKARPASSAVVSPDR